MGTKTHDKQRFIRFYKEETGKTEVVIDTRITNGYQL